MQRAIHENIGLLQSCDVLLGTLPPGEYARATDVCFNGAIGEHVRHLLDHYLGFFDGLENDGRIDYEARRRDARIERDLEFARTLLREVIGRLTRLEGTDLGVRIQVRIEVAGGDPVWADSCPARELCFLVNHTVHHCALIGVICRANGVGVPADFGVAPSTLRHRAGNPVKCAQ